MRIKESEFYKPFYLMGYDGEAGAVKLYNKMDVSHTSSPYRALLNNAMANLYIGNDELVIHKEKLSQFQKCEDFQTMEYSSKTNELYESEECYFHPDLGVFILLTRDLSDDYDTEVFEEGLYRVEYVYYKNDSPNTKANLIKLFSEYFEKYISKEAKVSILLKDNSGFDLKTHTIKPHRIDLDLMYNDDFMEVHTRVKHTITNENKGIVLLHGIAGSGKTNYIKWLTSQIPNKKFIFIPTTMISSLTDPSFIGVLVDNQNSVLVLEDCENYIAERTTLNSNTDVVSSILNIADGMLSDVLECQLICTFNSDISKIDSALLRKGRLIAEYKFRELTVEKCNAYLKSIGKDITVDEPRSLAELTNMDEKSLKDTTKENKKIGF